MCVSLAYGAGFVAGKGINFVVSRGSTDAEVLVPL